MTLAPEFLAGIRTPAKTYVFARLVENKSNPPQKKQRGELIRGRIVGQSPALGKSLRFYVSVFEGTDYRLASFKEPPSRPEPTNTLEVCENPSVVEMLCKILPAGLMEIRSGSTVLCQSAERTRPTQNQCIQPPLWQMTRVKPRGDN